MFGIFKIFTEFIFGPAVKVDNSNKTVAPYKIENPTTSSAPTDSAVPPSAGTETVSFEKSPGIEEIIPQPSLTVVESVVAELPVKKPRKPRQPKVSASAAKKPSKASVVKISEAKTRKPRSKKV
jgi:hypothetical protein